MPTTAASLLPPALLVAGFWAATALAGLADYGNGLERTVALLCAALLLVRLGPGRIAVSRLGVLGLCLALLVLVGYRASQAADAVEQGQPPTVDVGTTTIASVELAAEGEDPYTARIDAFGDEVAPGGTGLRHFAGYKYGPVMTWAYWPGVRVAGVGGYFTTSLLALLAVAAAASAWASRAGPVPALVAPVLVLSGAFVAGELFLGGVNDVVPVALVVAAFAARSRDRAVLAGVLLGLSFGAKLLPAALLALPLLLARRNGRLPLVLAASAVSLAVYVPVLLRSPREAVANLLLFNLERGGDGTALLDDVPEALRPGVKVLVALAVVAVLVVLARRTSAGRTTEQYVAAASALCLALLFAAGPVLHRNWLLWVLPLFAVALALRTASEDEVPVDEQQREQAETRG